MAKYRIKEHNDFYETTFEVQKKVWYIPFWYNFENVDAFTTGFYNTYDEALNTIDCDKHKTKHKIYNL